MKIRLKEKNKKKSDKKRFPIFYAGRIVIVSLILFYLLTSSIFVNIFIKAAASFLYEEKIDILNENPSESDISKFSVPIRLMLRIALSNLRISILLFILFVLISIPFKIFFYRKRKGLSISERISKIVKKTLISTPLIFSFIFFIFSFLSVFYSFRQIDVDLLTTPTIKSYLIDIQIISIIASLVSSIFIYSWQTFRVQQYYMTVVFDENELHFFPVKTHFTSIKYKIILGFVVTTFLPLLFLFFTIYLNLSHLNDVDNLNENYLRVIFGQFSEVIVNQPRYNPIVFFEKLNFLNKKYNLILHLL